MIPSHNYFDVLVHFNSILFHSILFPMLTFIEKKFFFHLLFFFFFFFFLPSWVKVPTMVWSHDRFVIYLNALIARGKVVSIGVMVVMTRPLAFVPRLLKSITSKSTTC